MSAGEAGLDGWSIDVTQSADMIDPSRLSTCIFSGEQLICITWYIRSRTRLILPKEKDSFNLTMRMILFI